MKKVSDAFENEENDADSHGPPLLQPVNVPDALHVTVFRLAVDVPDTDACVASSADVAGIEQLTFKCVLSF